MSRHYNCTECGEKLELGTRGAATIVSLTCWSCGNTMDVNQYKDKIVQ